MQSMQRHKTLFTLLYSHFSVMLPLWNFHALFHRVVLNKLNVDQIDSRYQLTSSFCGHLRTATVIRKVLGTHTVTQKRKCVFDASHDQYFSINMEIFIYSSRVDSMFTNVQLLDWYISLYVINAHVALYIKIKRLFSIQRVDILRSMTKLNAPNFPIMFYLLERTYLITEVNALWSINRIIVEMKLFSTCLE